MFIEVFKRIRNDLGLLWCETNSDGKAAIENEVPRIAFKISPYGFDRLNLMANTRRGIQRACTLDPTSWCCDDSLNSGSEA